MEKSKTQLIKEKDLQNRKQRYHERTKDNLAIKLKKIQLIEFTRLEQIHLLRNISKEIVTISFCDDLYTVDEFFEVFTITSNIKASYSAILKDDTADGIPFHTDISGNLERVLPSVTKIIITLELPISRNQSI